MSRRKCWFKLQKDEDDPDPQPQPKMSKVSPDGQHPSAQQIAVSVSSSNTSSFPSTSSHFEGTPHVQNTDFCDQPIKSNRSVLWNYFTRAAKCKTCNVLVRNITDTTLREHLVSNEKCQQQKRVENVRDLNQWEYFSQVGVCNTCKQVLSTPTGTTSTLLRHIDKHSQVKSEFLKASQSLKASAVKDTSGQQSLSTMFSPCLPSNSARSRAITKQIAVMIATDYQPISVVNDKGFKDLIHLLEPRYVIPSRHTFSRRVIPELYDSTKQKVEEMLIVDFRKGIHSVSVTVDCWTSAAQDPYISLTAHYMSPEVELRNFTLECSFFPGSHTGMHIKTKVEGMLDNWKIPTTVPIFIVTDNAKNMTSAILQTQWTHISCAAHSLQLAVHDANNAQTSLSPMLKKARLIVGHYNSSTQALDRLRLFQEQLNLPCKKLKTMVATRWNSEYYILASLVEQRATVSAELAKSGKLECLNLKEWDTIAIGLVQILHPIEEATQELCKESSPTLSMMIPIISSVLSTLQDLTIPERSGFGIVYGKNLMKAIMCRFPSFRTNNEYLLAMLLDPRFKGLILDECELQHGKAMLLKELKLQVTENDSQPSSLPSPKVLSEAKQHSFWKAFEKCVSASTSTSMNASNSLEDEIDKYIKMPTTTRTENPCTWWKHNEDNFPHLFVAAEKFLAIPATSASSERLFSKAGNVVTSRRGSLSAAHVERLVFLHDNLNL